MSEAAISVTQSKNGYITKSIKLSMPVIQTWSGDLHFLHIVYSQPFSVM